MLYQDDTMPISHGVDGFSAIDFALRRHFVVEGAVFLHAVFYYEIGGELHGEGQRPRHGVRPEEVDECAVKGQYEIDPKDPRAAGSEQRDEHWRKGFAHAS